MNNALTFDLNLWQKIDLLLSLHKTSRNEHDIQDYQTKTSRNHHEERLSLEKNSSWFASKTILETIDLAFVKHKQEIINVEIKPFSNDWCVGIFDGHGFFSVSLEFKKRNNVKSIYFPIVFGLVMEEKALLTMNTFMSIVNGKFERVNNLNKNKKLTSITYIVRRKKDINNLLHFFQKNLPQNEVKLKQLNLVNKVIDFRQNKELHDYSSICDLIKTCYQVTCLGKGKDKRKYTLEEALEKTYNWLN